MCLAVPGLVEAVQGEDPLLRTARVRFGGVMREVSLVYVPEAVPGDYVLVHVGFALSRIDEAEALRLLAALESLEEPAPEAAPQAAPEAS